MQSPASDLPTDPDQLRALLIASRAEVAAHLQALDQARALLQHRDLEIEALKAQLAKLRRMQFARSSEKLSTQPPASASPPRKPVRRPLPEQLPRESIVHAPRRAAERCAGSASRSRRCSSTCRRASR